MRPGRPRVQRPDACAAPETKGEPAWLGPGESGRRDLGSRRRPGLCSAREQVQADREEKCLSERTVERDFHKPGRELRTFSLAVNAKDREGNPLPTRWIRCVDWNGLTATYRKGDRVAVTGFFKVRKYAKDGESKEIRELVVTETRLEKMKIREQAA